MRVSSYPFLSLSQLLSFSVSLSGEISSVPWSRPCMSGADAETWILLEERKRKEKRRMHTGVCAKRNCKTTFSAVLFLAKIHGPLQKIRHCTCMSFMTKVCHGQTETNIFLSSLGYGVGCNVKETVRYWKNQMNMIKMNRHKVR